MAPRSPAASPSGEEKVLVFPRELLPFIGPFPQGIVTDPDLVEAGFDELMTTKGLTFMARAKAETSDTHVQLIPYVLVARGRELFRYRRAGSEGRLDGLYSVGVGGHINPVDGLGQPGPSAYWAALRRELAEEVGVTIDSQPPPLALIHDDSNPVGKVHLGVVHEVRLHANAEVRAADPPLAAGGFWPVSEVLFGFRGEPSAYEPWTRLYLKHVLGG